MTEKITSEDVYTQAVGDLYEEAGLSCDPVSRDTLLDLVAQHGVGPDSFVLDIGCANGGVSRALLDKTGCRIDGVELLEFLIDMGTKDNERLGVGDRFTIRQGSITDLPAKDETYDFVFCNDVIGLVEDLPKAMNECRRVLKPLGKMLVYASFGTDRLSARDAADLAASLGGASRGLDLAHAEQCIRDRFTVVEKNIIGSQFTQYDVEKSGANSQAAQDLLKVARLLTWPDKFIDKYGEKVYRIVLAEVQWSVFILLGKLQPTVFIVQRAD